MPFSARGKKLFRTSAPTGLLLGAWIMLDEDGIAYPELARLPAQTG